MFAVDRESVYPPTRHVEVGGIMSIGKVLRETRRELGMSQSDVAALLGVSLWSYHRVEHGTRSFDPAWVRLLPATMCIRIADTVASDLEAQAQGIRTAGRRLSRRAPEAA